MALAVPRALISAVLQSHPSHRKPTGAYLVTRDGLDNHWHLLPQLQDHPNVVEQRRSMSLLCGGMGHTLEPDSSHTLELDL
jgi:hypothetical protein